MTTTNSTTDQPTAQEHVIQRLRRRTAEAKRMGFRVRSEWLDGQQATWCEVAGVKTIFIDLSQSAAEQLQQLGETLEEFQRACSGVQNDHQSHADLDKRAA